MEKTMIALRNNAPKEDILINFEHCVIAADDIEKEINKLKTDLKI